MLKIVLLDPSLRDNEGNPSLNIGDLIIFDSVKRQLDEMFGVYEFIRISNHIPVPTDKFDTIKKADYIFVGGTNRLRSTTRDVDQYGFYRNKGLLWFIIPKIKNVILLSVGWGWKINPTLKVRLFYKKTLSKNIIQSTRDEYSCQQLRKIGIKNTLNTTCVTLWGIDHYSTKRKKMYSSCIFTLTEYEQNVAADNTLIEILVEHFTNRIVFFPQGGDNSGDLGYLKTLSAYIKYKHLITLLPHNYQHYKDFLLSTREITYIGTRLHGGIFCMQHGIETLILQVDNRAEDMKEGINLPVVERTDYTSIKKWLAGDLDFGDLKLPIHNISLWKNQFK